MISSKKLSSLAGCLGVTPTSAALTGQLTDLATLLALIAWTFGLSLGMSDPDELLFIALGLWFGKLFDPSHLVGSGMLVYALLIKLLSSFPGVAGPPSVRSRAARQGLMIAILVSLVPGSQGVVFPAGGGPVLRGFPSLPGGAPIFNTPDQRVQLGLILAGLLTAQGTAWLMERTFEGGQQTGPLFSDQSLAVHFQPHVPDSLEHLTPAALSAQPRDVVFVDALVSQGLLAAILEVSIDDLVYSYLSASIYDPTSRRSLLVFNFSSEKYTITTPNFVKNWAYSGADPGAPSSTGTGFMLRISIALKTNANVGLNCSWAQFLDAINRVSHPPPAVAPLRRTLLQLGYVRLSTYLTDMTTRKFAEQEADDRAQVAQEDRRAQRRRIGEITPAPAGTQAD